MKQIKKGDVSAEALNLIENSKMIDKLMVVKELIDFMKKPGVSPMDLVDLVIEKVADAKAQTVKDIQEILIFMSPDTVDSLERKITDEAFQLMSQSIDSYQLHNYPSAKGFNE